MAALDFRLANGEHNDLKGITIHHGRDYCFYAKGSKNITLANSNIVECIRYGIVAEETTLLTVEDNIVLSVVK